ncbi:hypothetical protein [Polyangium sp. 15x6]|nr:hypothetical protein [Polyangium sp. 15x6]MDI3291037.1 hypothetical protein [Polyangium sp. 15x6]
MRSSSNEPGFKTGDAPAFQDSSADVSTGGAVPPACWKNCAERSFSS